MPGIVFFQLLNDLLRCLIKLACIKICSCNDGPIGNPILSNGFGRSNGNGILIAGRFPVVGIRNAQPRLLELGKPRAWLYLFE